MRILVEPSDFLLRNAGDTAMLQVAVMRLAARWPDAVIDVLTDAPAALPRFTENTRPLVGWGRHEWLRDKPVPGAPHRLRGLLREWFPDSARRSLQRRLLEPGAAAAVASFFEALSNADLVVVTGMGGITDAFSDYADGVLETLRLGMHFGACTAMFGQGMGPLEGPALRQRAAAILPRVDLIALREGLVGRPLLAALGVATERVVVSGDDAIEMAGTFRTDEPGEWLGINLRASDYAGVHGPLVERVRDALQGTARKLGAPMLSVPISRVPGESDTDTAMLLMAGYERSEAPCELAAFADVMAQIRRCRVMVTGSYHAGVFALSLGIPAVCLAASEYYVDKFQGLADQFGPGCEVVRMTGDSFEEQFGRVLESAWQGAATLRPGLLARAASQIEAGRAAYDRLVALVGPRSVGSGQR